MKKNNDWKKQVFSNKGVSLLSQTMVIIIVFAIYILGDYLTFKGSIEFIKDPLYWATTTISLFLVIALMITVRAMRKNKQVEKNENIANNMKTVQAVRKVVLINAYDKEFQNYIDKVNEEYKYETYINNVTKKINFLKWRFLLSAKQKDKKLRQYEEQLRLPFDKVMEKHIKFKKVTQTGLFAWIDGKLAVVNKHDISTHESKDIASMVGYKALIVYILTAFSGTLVVNFLFSGWSALWGTLLKLFSMAFATNSAIKQADDFVDYNIEQALDNRLRILLGFVNSNEEIKNKVLDKLREDNTVNNL